MWNGTSRNATDTGAQVGYRSSRELTTSTTAAQNFWQLFAPLDPCDANTQPRNTLPSPVLTLKTRAQREKVGSERFWGYAVAVALSPVMSAREPLARLLNAIAPIKITKAIPATT